MKKILGILSIIILASVFIASYLIITHQRSGIRKQIKHRIIEGIDKKDLVYLSFTEHQINNELTWKHSKEFCYKGEMYDVVERITKGDTTHFWCWWDHEETLLNKKLNELVSVAMGTQKKNKENNERLASFYKSFFNSWFEFPEIQFREIKGSITFYYSSYTYTSNPPPVPPPDYC